MTGRTRSFWTVRSIVGCLGLGLLVAAIASGSSAYDPWAFVEIVAIPAGFGAVVGLVMILLRRGGTAPVLADRDPFEQDTSYDVINMSRIRVAGVGGLGMVLVALAMAWVFPRIGQSLLIGVAGGLVVSAFIILRRRRSGPLSSSNRGPDGHSILAAGPDDDEPTPRPVDDRSSRAERQTTATGRRMQDAGAS